MDKTSLGAKQLSVRPHKLKNIIFTLIFAALGTIGTVLTIFTVRSEPEILSEKILNCIFFALFFAFSACMFSGMLDSIRNLFAMPTFKLNEDEIFICKYGTAPLSELKNTELKKNGKILVFNFNDGSSAVLRSRISEIPLETIVYAISLRQK